MWSFEGNAKSRPKINLGGNVSSTSKADILQKTREDRRRRELDRKRDLAATKIQITYRRHCEKLSTRLNLRVQFDSQIAQLQDLGPSTFNHLVRHLVEFFEPKHDKFRTEHLVMLVMQKITSNQDFSLFSNFFLDLNSHHPYHPHYGEWWGPVILLIQFLKMVIKVFDTSSNMSFELLRLSTDRTSYGSNSFADGMYYYLLQRLVQLGVFDISGRLISEGVNCGPLIVTLQQLAIVNAGVEKNKAKFISLCHHRFLLELMTSLDLREKLHQTSDGLNLLKNIPSWALLGRLNQLLEVRDESLVKLDRPYIMNLIFNFVSFISVIPSESSHANLNNYLESLIGLFRLLVKFNGELENQIQLSDDDEDDNDKSVGLLSGEVEKIFSHEQYISLVSCVVESRDCKLIGKLMEYSGYLSGLWPQLQPLVLVHLLNNHDDGLIPAVCSWVINSQFFSALGSSGQLDWGSRLMQRTEECSNEWIQLYMVLVLLQRQLEVNLDSVIDLSQLDQLLDQLGNLVFGLHWHGVHLPLTKLVGGSCVKLGSIRKVGTELMRQINDINNRRPFLPAEVWIQSWDRLQQTGGFAELAAQDLFNYYLYQQQQDDDDDDANNPTTHSPRVSILHNIPFIIPFTIRISIFSRLLELEKVRNEGVLPHSLLTRGINDPTKVRRDHALEDGFDQLNSLNLKGRISITLVNQLGMDEPGIDGGGVFKEFLNLLVHQAFAPEFGLFLNTGDQLVYPNPSRHNRQSSQLRLYRFLGRMVGKAVYEGILMDIGFAQFFLSKLLGRMNYLDDLPSLDADLHRGLVQLMQYPGHLVERDLNLNFTLMDDSNHRAVDLIRGGSAIPVTKDNRLDYVHRVADFRLNTQLRPQCDAFLSGLDDLFPISWLRLFDPMELPLVISGGTQPIDVDDLQAHTTYSGIYDPAHSTILNFWATVRELDPSQLSLLVKFITSCPRPPLQGFQALSPPLCIRDSGHDNSRLPTASTCVNLLKLPNYTTKGILKT